MMINTDNNYMSMQLFDAMIVFFLYKKLQIILT